MHRSLPLALLLATFPLATTPLHAAPPIPLDLPSPDGKPGNPAKPVQVYILAGQSNMVGMGDLAGAKPPFPKIYYSADPAILPGATPIGRDNKGKPLDWVAVERHGVYDAKATIMDGGKAIGAATPVALGTVSAHLPTIEGPQTLVVQAQIDVPVTGEFLIHAGFGESTHNTILLDGKPVAGKITLEAGKRYPLEITYTKSGSCALWLERVDIPGQGDLTLLTRQHKKFPYLIDASGQWTARQDVTYIDPRLFPDRPASALSATSNNGKSIGPELGFGSVVGTFHDAQVLLIKTAMGNRSLRFDFQPPSSGRKQPDSEYEGYEYRAMIQGVRGTLAKIDRVVPGYQGQGYEIAGFGWFQGHKDSGSPKEEYEQHLVHLIQDLRKEFDAPAMPAVIATVGFQGYRISTTPWWEIWQAQMAVGDPKQHPEFAGNVASVDTRDFWREADESPRNQDYHYHRNPETYLLIGEAMGRAMVRLSGGEAAEIPKSGREAKAAAEPAVADKPAPTNAQKSAHVAASRPLILDGALSHFLADPQRQKSLHATIHTPKPGRNHFLNDVLDDVVDFHRAAGIDAYSWKPFAGDLRNASWDYLGFDLTKNPAQPDTDTKAKPSPRQRIALPAGMENWFTPEFDPRKAGWKSGPAPFGESAGHIVLPEWAAFFKEQRTPKTLTDTDVLLLRQTFAIPPFKDGHRYRIRLAGSIHNNMGEAFTLHANGRLLVEIHRNILDWRREGRLPRGVMITPDLHDLFKDGKVLLAASNFTMPSPPAQGLMPPGPALSIWIEEQKIPPVSPAP
jgi:alpha-galactosidase